MKTKAVRLYGKMDLRLEEFELPPVTDEEILIKVVATSLSASTYRGAVLGDAADKPVIVGHEMAGEIFKVGTKWQEKYKAGEKFSLHHAVGNPGFADLPGFSFKYCGGDTVYAIIPPEVLSRDSLLVYRGEGFFKAALSLPFSHAIGACHSLFRTDRQRHAHYLGIKDGGRMAIIGGCDPTGLAALDYALSGEFRPKQLIVTDHDEAAISRARERYGSKAQKAGISLMIINTGELPDAQKTIMELTENEGFDDMLVMVPFARDLEFGESMLGFNGCMNFLADPMDENLSAKVNFYDVHYTERHILGTISGNVHDSKEALELMEEGKIEPEALITHIGGLDAAAEATLDFPKLNGGKKMIYTGISLPLTALSELEEIGKDSVFFRDLASIVEKNKGRWSVEAENYLLEKGEKI